MKNISRKVGRITTAVPFCGVHASRECDNRTRDATRLPSDVPNQNPSRDLRLGSQGYGVRAICASRSRHKEMDSGQGTQGPVYSSLAYAKHKVDSLATTRRHFSRDRFGQVLGAVPQPMHLRDIVSSMIEILGWRI